jgi:hypothetical protein
MMATIGISETQDAISKDQKHKQSTDVGSPLPDRSLRLQQEKKNDVIPR